MIGHFLKLEYEELIAHKDWESLRVAFEDLEPADIAEILDDLPPEDSGVIFRILPRQTAGLVFEYLPIDQQAELVGTLSSEGLVNVLNGMSPDDRTRLFEELPAEVTKRALETLAPDQLKTARQLLGYPENSAGRYMTPEYLALKPEMTAAEALNFVRQKGKGAETLNVLYIIDEKGVLLADIRLADLVMASLDAKLRDVPTRNVIALPATAPRSEVVSAFEKYDRVALPVTDTRGVLVGIITVDDVLDVAEAEATKDIQKLGGLEALDAAYFEIGLLSMLRKRGTWLAVLFLGEMLTSTAMGFYEDEISHAVVLALFMPLIISSGGNSGSQSTSLMIRALAVREVQLGDWFRVLRREVAAGLALGGLLGAIGMVRIMVWQVLGFKDYSVSLYPLFMEAKLYAATKVGFTVAISLVGVVLFGTVSGSMLPFILRRVGVDPATASAPFVATLVDVTGLVIYFSVGSLILRGTLL